MTTDQNEMKEIFRSHVQGITQSQLSMLDGLNDADELSRSVVQILGNIYVPPREEIDVCSLARSLLSTKPFSLALTDVNILVEGNSVNVADWIGQPNDVGKNPHQASLVLRDLLSDNGVQVGAILNNLACAYAWLCNVDDALATFDLAIAEGVQDAESNKNKVSIVFMRGMP
jgi:hypothetical protein